MSTTTSAAQQGPPPAAFGLVAVPPSSTAWAHVTALLHMHLVPSDRQRLAVASLHRIVAAAPSASAGTLAEDGTSRGAQPLLYVPERGETVEAVLAAGLPRHGSTWGAFLAHSLRREAAPAARRTLLLADVRPGRALPRAAKDAWQLEGPPLGYDSLYVPGPVSDTTPTVDCYRVWDADAVSLTWVVHIEVAKNLPSIHDAPRIEPTARLAVSHFLAADDGDAHVSPQQMCDVPVAIDVLQMQGGPPRGTKHTFLSAESLYSDRIAPAMIDLQRRRMVLEQELVDIDASKDALSESTAARAAQFKRDLVTSLGRYMAVLEDADERRFHIQRAMAAIDRAQDFLEFAQHESRRDGMLAVWAWYQTLLPNLQAEVERVAAVPPREYVAEVADARDQEIARLHTVIREKDRIIEQLRQQQAGPPQAASHVHQSLARDNSTWSPKRAPRFV